MNTQPISNQALYELILKFKDEMEKRFDQQNAEISGIKTEMDHRFDQQNAEISSIKTEMDRRFDQQNAEISGIKTEIRELRSELKHDIAELRTRVEKNSEKIDELQHKENKIQVTFSSAFAGATIAISGFIAYIVAVFTGHYVVKR